MSTPVKTLLMEAIGDALEGITILNDIIRGQAIPSLEEVAKYPCAFFFDETETKEARNRTSRKSFDLVVQAWALEKKASSLDEQLDLLDAEIEMAILTDEEVRTAAGAVEIMPISGDKLYVDDGRGILQAVFRVSYSHAWKNPYDPAK